jgi:hypothetical protein
MSASSVLSKQLFHGSPVDFKPGDIIRPRSHGSHENVNYGVNPSYGEETHNYSYATNDVEEAKWFGGKEANVYEVEPLGKTKSRRLYRTLPEGAPKDAAKIREHLSTEGFKVKRKLK